MSVAGRLARLLGLVSLIVTPAVLISGVEPARAVGATFTVNSAVDAAVGESENCPPAPAPNTCRLRDALAAAEASPGDNAINITVGPINLTFGPLSYGPTSGTLTIDGAGHTVSQSSGTVILSTRDLTIKNATIVGGGDAVSLASITGLKLTVLDATVTDAGGLGRSALATAGTGSSITVTKSTITAGGAAVYAGDGSATVTDSSLAGRTAEGISANVGAIVTRSTIHAGTGAIHADAGPVTVVDSTIAADTGTGILTSDPAQITGSTISGGGGDGVKTSTDVVVVNSTIANNRGCGIAAAGSVTFAYATVTANGASSCGANVRANSLTSFGSVMAQPPVSGANCTVSNTTTHGYNYDSDGTCGLVGAGDQSSAGDPQLGELGAHGGSTETRAPQIASALIDKIPTDECGGPGAPIPKITTDQRGDVRPQGPACDIGAVEVESKDVHAAAGAPVYSTIPTGDPVVFFTIDDGIMRDPAAVDFIRSHHIPVTLFLTPAFARPGPRLLPGPARAGRIDPGPHREPSEPHDPQLRGPAG